MWGMGLKRAGRSNPCGLSPFWLLAALAALLPTTVLAAHGGNNQLDGWRMGLDLVGGLALFLLGMEQMTDALSAVAGGRMRRILARLTTNPATGVATGAAVTAVIQSSSVTTVLVVGFISAGLISLPQSVGIIFGAEIGTTVTAQIVAFNVTKYALPAIALGFLIAHVRPRETEKLVGRAIMGFGLVFFGMWVMKSAMKPLSDYQPFLDLLAGVENPLVGIAVSAGFTALIQSSSATTAIVIAMASQGLVPLPLGIALIFGANIGTCVTALLASIGRPRVAVRAALVHITFNLSGVLLWVSFVGPLAEVVTWLSPAHTELSGLERLAAETPRQIANAHTTFNCINTLLFLPFAGQFARFVTWLVPDGKDQDASPDQPVPQEAFLDQKLLHTPELALAAARREIKRRIGERVRRMLHMAMPATLDADRHALTVLSEMDHQVDISYTAAVEYLGQISAESVSEARGPELGALLSMANHLENIGDIIETNMTHIGRQRIAKGLEVSPETRALMARFHAEVCRSLDDGLEAVLGNERAAAAVIDRKPVIQALVDEAEEHQAVRLIAREPERMATYALEMDIFDKLTRIYYHTKKIAKAAAPDAPVVR